MANCGDIRLFGDARLFPEWCDLSQPKRRGFQRRQQMINLHSAQKLLVKLSTGPNPRTLGAAESLTAGLFSASFCSVPGASKVFKGAVVSYANEVKENLLGVAQENIAK